MSIDLASVRAYRVVHSADLINNYLKAKLRYICVITFGGKGASLISRRLFRGASRIISRIYDVRKSRVLKT